MLFGLMKNSSSLFPLGTAHPYQMQQLAPSCPLVTREMFAQLTGLTAPTVFSMCDRGYLPTMHLGGRRVFVNLEALRLKALQAAGEVAQ